MNRIHLSNEAANDLDAIWDYIADDNPDAADLVIAKITAQLLMLAEQPLMGRNRDELLLNVRSSAVGNYLIFYRPVSGVIEVVRVIDGRHNLSSIFPGESPE